MASLPGCLINMWNGRRSGIVDAGKKIQDDCSGRNESISRQLYMLFVDDTVLVVVSDEWVHYFHKS